MVATGADDHDIENALNGVRQIAWAAGLTLHGRHAVLLAFADVRVSCEHARSRGTQLHTFFPVHQPSQCTVPSAE